MHVLVGGAMLLTAGALAAQERPAVASGEQKTNQKQADPGVRPAFGEGGARPGEYVAVTRKDGQKMTGTLVWIDEKNNRLYLRPQPGQAPVAIARDDVNTVAVQPREDGGIRTASTGYTTGYEIHTIEIFNGPNRSLHFFDRTLSPEERARLAEMEKSADDVARKSEIVDSLSEELKNQAQYGNQPTVVSTYNAGAYNYMPFAFYPVNYYFPYATVYPFYNNYFPYAYTFPYVGGGAAGQNSTVVVQNPSGSSSSPGELLKALTTAQEQLAQARSNYTAARNLAIFDGQGRVVAVRLDEQPKAIQPAVR